MTDIILHHYDTSPFSEKMRLIFGYKKIAWVSVIVPAIMPKPDVVALTGGYRRTPFLQIGADIYCDTALMCRVVDRLHPKSPLYPHATAGLAEILAQWADSALFWAAVPYTIQPVSLPHMFGNAPAEMLQAFMADRAAMTPHMTRPTIPDAAAQVATYFTRLENLLADGREFLLGAAPSIADFATVQSLWFMHRAPPIAAMIDAYPHLTGWYGRMHAFGHGTSRDMASAEAIAIAHAAEPAPAAVPAGSFTAQGAPVSVTPTDYAHDTVHGTLAGISDDEVVIARDDARAGRVHVHFPRIGYQIKTR